MNSIQVFNSPDFGEVRTIIIDNDVWFCLSDVCRVLDIKNPSDMKSRLNPKGVVITDTPTTSGTQPMNYINEPNLYRTIFQSRKPEAEKFSDWVTNDVLPSIRKTGSYSAIDRSKLSDQMQMFYALADHGAMLEMEQKRQAEQIKAIETTVTNMKEIMVESIGDWKNDINKRIRDISQKSGIDYQELYTLMYEELRTSANANLDRLCENKKKRLEQAGNTKTFIAKETTKIAVIYDNQRLRLIFEGIVKRWAVKYCA